ncbi:MAG: HzsA-related protein, partial [Limisphaerales bacterium]
GIPRGTIDRLRVIALEFRPAGVGNNSSGGPGGGALISTPVAIGNGTWDVKVVLGETPVQADGSAFFKAPARTPLYFQALDTNGHAVQTMRSWSTLQPGEVQSCVGCHESKNTAPPTDGYRGTLALRSGPQPLTPFHGPPRGFSFPQEIQPILDRHCVRCHDQPDRQPKPARLARSVINAQDPDWTSLPLDSTRSDPPSSAAGVAAATATTPQPAFSLMGDTLLDQEAKRRWSQSYLNLTLARPTDNDPNRGSYTGVYDGQMVNWIGSQSIPAPLPPYAAGAARSALFPLLARGHYDVRLSREELDKLACWIDLLVPYCGDYTEAGAWTDAERKTFERYADKRRRMEDLEQRNLEAWQARHASDSGVPEAVRDPGPDGSH